MQEGLNSSSSNLNHEQESERFQDTK
jgi:hypothetical protein